MPQTIGKRVIRWIEQNCVIPDGPDIGQPFVIPAFWRDIIKDWYEVVPDGHGGLRRRYSQGLIGIAKKNIKTSIAAALSLWELAGSEDPAAYVLSAAATEEQGANLLFGSAYTIATKSESLKDALKAERAQITVTTQPRARLKNLTSRAGSNDGANARAVFCDELHEWTGASGRQLFAVLEGALTSRPDATLLAITTAGYDEDSICHDKYEYGKRLEAGDVEDPRFYFRWFEAPSGCDYKDKQYWVIPNPLLGITVHESVLEDRILRDPESVFRRYHLNQWVAGEDIWISASLWDACGDAALTLDPELPLHVGIDVGIRHDSSAVVAAQHQPAIGRTVVRSKVWENPYPRSHSLHDSWSLNIELIRAHLMELRDKFPMSAAEVDGRAQPGPGFYYDPFSFTESAQQLAGEGLCMVEFPQHDSYMIPASQALHDSVIDVGLAHDGDETLRRHILSAIADQKYRGWRLAKPKGSQRHIDAAIATAIAVYRARTSMTEESVYESRGVLVF